MEMIYGDIFECKYPYAKWQTQQNLQVNQKSFDGSAGLFLLGRKWVETDTSNDAISLECKNTIFTF